MLNCHQKKTEPRPQVGHRVHKIFVKFNWCDFKIYEREGRQTDRQTLARRSQYFATPESEVIALEPITIVVSK